MLLADGRPVPEPREAATLVVHEACHGLGSSAPGGAQAEGGDEKIVGREARQGDRAARAGGRERQRPVLDEEFRSWADRSLPTSWTAATKRYRAGSEKL